MKLGDWSQTFEGDTTQGLAAISVRSVTPHILQQTARRVNVPETFGQVLGMTSTAETPYLEFYVQLRLVAEYSRLSAIKQMHSYATNPTNLAIVVSTAVLDEAESFKNQYQEILERSGDEFPFLRLLNPAALLPLSASFPDLYYVAVESAKSAQSLNNAFQTSHHPTATSKDTLKKWVKRSIVGVGVSGERKRRLETMGINPDEAIRKINRLEKREDDE